ncbi:MAG: YCF48-related protein [Melioribacteraceae bacterium]
MKNLLIGLLFITSQLLAQWEWQNPLPQGNTLNDVKIVNDKIVIAVGDLGTVIRSVDAGETWNKIYLGTEMKFSSVHFGDENTGYILGVDGTIFKTTDRGERWKALSTGIKTTYHAICFVSKDIGYVCGYYGYIMKTTDGGETWEKKNSKTINTLNKIHFLNTTLGFAVGKEGTITKTTDGGNTWKGISIDETAELKSVYFVDELNGWVVSGNGKIFKTLDGGSVWTLQYSNSTTSFTSLCFEDQNNGITWGSNSCITNNGGKKWNLDYKIFSVNSVDIKLKLGFAVGLSGLIGKTSDNGLNWKTNILAFSYLDLRSIFFINKNVGWTSGYVYPNGIYKTDDGGSTWKLLPNKANVQRMYFKDELNGIGFGNYVTKTTDGGVVWDTLLFNNSYIRSYSIVENNIWIVEGSTKIYKSIDDGKSWEIIIAKDLNTLSGGKQLQSIFFIDKLRGWAITLQGGIIKSVDGGNTWVLLKDIKHFGLQAVHFADENNGWICGDLGYILHTTNGGDTWNQQKTESTAILYSFRFINKHLGWTVGTFGTILKTTNGGEDWIQQKSNTLNNLLTVYFLDENTGWVVGANGTILKTTNGGTTFIEEEKEIPSAYELSQNYPNPFNPETTISYKIQAASQVSLKVYDVLGREVGTLVNEYKQPGVYNSTFSTLHSSLTSGIYFYKLQAGNPSAGSGQGFVQTKKMILIK